LVRRNSRIAVSVRHLFGSIAIILACVILAFVVAILVDLARPKTFLEGRNFIRVAILASVLIAAAALRRSKQALQTTQLILELVVVESVIAGLIWWFAGAITFDQFFISWWLGLSGFVMLPWIVCSAIRSAALSR
jgi:hypothetical protein